MLNICRSSNQHLVNAVCLQGYPYSAKRIYLNFQPLEVVGRGSETQFQMVEKPPKI